MMAFPHSSGVPVPHEGLGGDPDLGTFLADRVPVPHEGLGGFLDLARAQDAQLFPFPMRG